ncbi:MAG: ExbD/TolR family protein [Pontixanthobacter sp.]
MAEINVTPFVDVMLVLLIIFMVTAPLLNSGVPVELPDSRAAALPQEQDPVTVTVSPDGAIYVGDDPVAPGALAQTLTGIPRGPDGTLPQINLRGDRSIDYGRMMGVMGELNRAGFTSIALLTGAATAEPVVEQGVVAAPAPTQTPAPQSAAPSDAGEAVSAGSDSDQ